MEREDIKMLVKKWWEIYDDKTLDFNYKTIEGDDGGDTDDGARQPFLAALSEAGVVQYHTAPSAA